MLASQVSQAAQDDLVRAAIIQLEKGQVLLITPSDQPVRHGRSPVGDPVAAHRPRGRDQGNGALISFPQWI